MSYMDAYLTVILYYKSYQQNFNWKNINDYIREIKINEVLNCNLQLKDKEYVR